MQPVFEAYADLSIRRACAFVGLATATLMVALSFDAVLSCRSGAQLVALLAVGLVMAAWRAPHRNLRHSEVYALLIDSGLPRGRLATTEMQAMLAEVLRERLLWHAERVSLIALGLWGLALLLWMLS
ncbi:hypothetical protein [Sabulicella glaciei]|uniref:Uncharacterized protein n=1 Tax=Sabulicella glaciei TaxID=2984948 RepID=A0ABT3NXF8_9PROT|nr:hypothetical protein [Roseococcus sp. MDT2-1-1]MCW8086810.1 hypothetical protein [Roseococcus sp. MDT2-1-1]